MVTLGRVFRRPSAFALIVLALVVMPGSRSRGQYFGGGMGYGGFGYGMSGYGFGYGMPGYGYGMGGYGMGGYGMGGYGYASPAFGYGYGYGYPGYGYPSYGMAFGGSTAFGNYYGNPYLMTGLFNPLFGVGMTPLGLQSYLYERNVLGRGLTTYSSGYSGYVAPSGTVIRYVRP